MRVKQGMLATCLGLLAGGPALAQGLAIDGLGGYNGLSSASKSADAVFGSSGGGSYGGSLTYAFANGFYLEGGARYFSKTGQRVFLASPAGPIFPLGFPLKLRLVPIFLNLGYRFGGRPIVPYLAVGGNVTTYHEESTTAGLTQTEDTTKTGGQVLAGLEFGKGHLRLAGEAGYAFLPNTVGLGGVSKVYGEKDLGGFSMMGKLIFSFSRRD